MKNRLLSGLQLAGECFSSLSELEEENKKKEKKLRMMDINDIYIENHKVAKNTEYACQHRCVLLTWLKEVENKRMAMILCI